MNVNVVAVRCCSGHVALHVCIAYCTAVDVPLQSSHLLSTACLLWSFSKPVCDSCSHLSALHTLRQDADQCSFSQCLLSDGRGLLLQIQYRLLLIAVPERILLTRTWCLE